MYASDSILIYTPPHLPFLSGSSKSTVNTADSSYNCAHGDRTRDYRERCDYAESTHYGLNKRDRNSMNELRRLRLTLKIEKSTL